jgi:inosine-uridine nucleoside N-ribohydrolase
METLKIGPERGCGRRGIRESSPPGGWCGALLAVAALLQAIVLHAAPVERMKVVLDTDIGTDIDDAWALAFVLSHPGFEPVGVTITDGDTASRAKVACKLLHLAGRDDLPVAVGRSTPVPPDRVDHQFQWAEDFTAKRPGTRSAAEFLVETAKAHPGEITLIAVGPLQNVADALRRAPEIARLWKRVVLMSGCVYGTSYSTQPIAEWNVVSATADAQLVYDAGLPLTIVPLDSTTQVQLKEEERQRLRAHRTPLTTALESLYRLWLESPTERMTLHDQLAVAEAASPGTFFGERRTVSLRVDGEGYTRIDDHGKPVSVCLQPKRDEFMGYYLEVLLRQRLGLPARE